jgi:PAS domain S-box-containing protein
VSDLDHHRFGERGQQLAFAVLDALTERVACYRVSDLRIVYCNRSWAAGHGVTPERMIGADLTTLLSEGELEGLHAQLERLSPQTPLLSDPEFRPAPEGSGRWVEWVDRWLPGPDGGLVVAVGRDVTELRQAQAELAALALRDPLTGLANRRLLDELLQVALARGPRSGEEVVVLFIDVDGLKQINDSHGHEAGDRLLRSIAERLDDAFREADVVARIGGDEFVVVLETAEHDDAASATGSRPCSGPRSGSPTTSRSCPPRASVSPRRCTSAATPPACSRPPTRRCTPASGSAPRAR